MYICTYIYIEKISTANKCPQLSIEIIKSVQYDSDLLSYYTEIDLTDQNTMNSIFHYITIYKHNDTIYYTVHNQALDKNQWSDLLKLNKI